MQRTSPARTVISLSPGLGLEDEFQRALEDVADLFVVVVMQGDDCSLFEQDAGDHDVRPDEELAADEGIELLDGDVVPVGVGELLGWGELVGLVHDGCSSMRTRIYLSAGLQDAGCWKRLYSRSLAGCLARHGLDRRGAGAFADHRLEVRAAMVFRPVGVVDAVIDRSIDRLKGDLFRHAGGDDPPRLLPHCGLVPARALPVVAAHIEGVVDGDGPDPGRSAVGHTVFAERCDVQVIGLGDLAKFVF